MRIESDFLGEVEVPKDAYYGAFTVRANRHFKLSTQKVHKEIIYSVAFIKYCAAVTNHELGKIDQKTAGAITNAVDDIWMGRFDDQFVLDAYQAGAGTPLHMNVNEVIANAAEELLGGRKGNYNLIHPNNTVNMSQSSNDVVPSAIKIASIMVSKKLIESIEKLSKYLKKKAMENKDSLKIGRTHLQDAVPMTYGQTFDAFSRAVEKDIIEIKKATDALSEIGIGGTATGSGITAHPQFREKIVSAMKRFEYRIRLTNEPIEINLAKDPIEMTQNMNDFITFSSSLKRYATTLNRIANDFRLLVSGPKSAIAEIQMPEIEPGSSIMPGKINPSVAEALNMVCCQIMANDLAVLLGANGGQLELNFFTPLIGQNILSSEKLLINATEMFCECISATVVDKKRAKENLEKTFGYATALNPYLGYSAVSKLVREALARNITLREIILEKKILEEKDFDKIISKAIGPSEIDNEIMKKIGKL